jgi:hypothetical protein
LCIFSKKTLSAIHNGLFLGLPRCKISPPKKKKFNGGNEMDIVKNDEIFEMDECCEKSRDF